MLNSLLDSTNKILLSMMLTSVKNKVCQCGCMVKVYATEQKRSSGSGFNSRSKHDVGRGGIVVNSVFRLIGALILALSLLHMIS